MVARKSTPPTYQGRARILPGPTLLVVFPRTEILRGRGPRSFLFFIYSGSPLNGFCLGRGGLPVEKPHPKHPPHALEVIVALWPMQPTNCWECGGNLEKHHATGINTSSPFFVKSLARPGVRTFEFFWFWFVLFVFCEFFLVFRFPPVFPPFSFYDVHFIAMVRPS